VVHYLQVEVAFAEDVRVVVERLARGLEVVFDQMNLDFALEAGA
jgi:hypothetical protein